MFDIDAFLAQPLTARLATNGPTVRPTWFLWEDGCFWFMTGPWAKLLGRIRRDPTIAVVIDICEPATGEVKQVIARGRADIRAFDTERAHRMLSRYLGADASRWDVRFQHYLLDDPVPSSRQAWGSSPASRRRRTVRRSTPAAWAASVMVRAGRGPIYPRSSPSGPSSRASTER